MLEPVEPTMAWEREAFADYLLAGETGVGKTAVVQSLARTGLTLLGSVVLLDVGGSHKRFCRDARGTYVTVGDGGNATVQTYGNAPVHVCDFGFGPTMRSTLPFPIDRALTATGGLLVVDETVGVLHRYPALFELLRMHITGGGRFLVTGQRREDVDAFAQLSARVRVLTLSNPEWEAK